MTIDEAIKHCEEVAAENEEIYKADCRIYSKEVVEKYPSPPCKKCAEEHRQLAEWLKELKTSRECIERICIACLELNGDGFEDEVVEAMNEYLYDTGKEWEL